MDNRRNLFHINRIKEKVNVDLDVYELWKEKMADSNEEHIVLATEFANFQVLEEIEELNKTDRDVFKLADDAVVDYRG